MEPEQQIERTVVQYAESLGWQAIKLDGFNKRGIPDRIFVREGEKIIWIEFKACGEQPNDIQDYWHKMLKKMGFEVHVIDNIEAGKRCLMPDYTCAMCDENVWGSLDGECQQCSAPFCHLCSWHEHCDNCLLGVKQ